MPFEMKNQMFTVNSTSSFTFNNPVKQYFVGVCYWNFVFNEGEYSYTHNLKLALSTSVDGNSVNVTPHATLSGDGYFIDPDASQLHLACLAVTESEDGNVFIAEKTGVSCGGESSPTQGLSESYSETAILSGFHSEYHTDDAKMGQVAYSAGAIRINENLSVKSIGLMQDEDGDIAVTNTLDAFLLQTAQEDSNLKIVYVENLQKPNDVHDVDGFSGYNEVVPFLQAYKLGLTDNYQIYNIGGGVNDWTFTPDKKTIQLTRPHAKCTASADNAVVESGSSVSLVLVGIKE